MKKIERLKRKWNNYKYDHLKLLETLNISKSVVLATIAAILYAFGFYCFITPAFIDHTLITGSSVVTGGVGGFSQIITLVLQICGVHPDVYLMQSILYFALNVPILIFAFFKVGKKFALITLLNVGLSSAFIQVFNNISFMHEIAVQLQNSNLTRVLFAGVTVGIASALAYKGEVSCGGIDVFSYYFALRKSTSVGKYSTMINSVMIVVYTALTIGKNSGQYVEVAFLNMLFSILYLFVTMLVVDFINTRNKKVQLQIITSKEEMSSILISNFPHSTTNVAAKGGYSHQDKTIILMTISSNEVKKVVSLVRKVDEHSFISVTALIQAYGNFFIKPVE